jgi:hypothetical protein
MKLTHVLCIASSINICYLLAICIEILFEIYIVTHMSNLTSPSDQPRFILVEDAHGANAFVSKF